MKQYENYNQKLRIPDKIFTPIRGVRLTGGLFRRVFDDNVKFNLTQLDMDRMRYWFDVKAGREPKGIRYSGHFEDNLKGQTASQYLMCAGNALRWEENEELRRGMNEVLDFLEDSQEIDGFLMPISKNDFAWREYPHYVRIWLTYGLLAAGMAGEKRAYKMLRLWQDWFNRCPDLPVIKYLELAFQGTVASPQVYLSPVGCEDDIKISRETYEEDWRLGQFLHNEPWAVCTRKQPGVEPHPHGSELEAFEGYLDMYRYTGAPYYLNAVRNVLLQYRRDWQHPGGGIIMCERFGGAAQGHRLIYNSKDQRYNELCTSAFWIGINQRMHRLYPDVESYVFEIEQSLYNVVFALQYSHLDIRSFAMLDECVREPVRPNSCCSGTGTKIMACLPEYLFTLNENTLYCDVYADSELLWQRESRNVKVSEKTDYPFDRKVCFTFESDAPHDYTVKFRIPCYSASSVSVYLNGEKIAEGEPGTYVTVTRLWQNGDKVEFEIPFAWKCHSYSGEHDVEGYIRMAYTYGPLLYALRGPRSHPNGVTVTGKGEDFTSRLKKKRGKNLHFKIEGMEGYDMVPYYEIIPGEHFVCFPLFEKKE
jgi:hypothetical protein